VSGFQASRKLWFIIAVVLGSLTAACTSKPIYNVSNAPVPSAASKANLDAVSKAIQRAGASLGWHMQETQPGHILGTLNLRTHRAVVDINYTPQAYSIQYKDSIDLGYDGTNIHRNYNGWIQNLDRAIQAQLIL
jgi:hypothetical protein